jgi:hypothetical protein
MDIRIKPGKLNTGNMNTKTFDIIEDMDGDFYIIEDMGLVYYLNELQIISIDEINNKVTIAI